MRSLRGTELHGPGELELRGPGELLRSAHDRIRATNPHKSHKHEHLGTLVPKGEPAHNRARRLQHVGVSGTGVGMRRIVEAQRAKKQRILSDEN
jgi:hypothetical protein